MTPPAGQSIFEWAHELKGSVADSRIDRKGYSANPLKRGGAGGSPSITSLLLGNSLFAGNLQGKLSFPGPFEAGPALRNGVFAGFSTTNSLRAEQGMQFRRTGK